MLHLGEHHELHHHHYRLKFTELNEIYIFNSLRSLAFTFIAYFIPIYLLSTQGSIKIVFLYYAILYGGEALFEPVSAKLIRHLGPKHTIALSVPFLLAHFFFLQTLSVYNWPIWLLSISGSIGLAFFWQAYHYDFSKAKRKKKATSDVTNQYIIIYLLAVAAPFLGGFLMDNGGPFITFGIVISLLLIGTTVLFRTTDKHETTNKLNFSKLNYKCLRRDALSYAGLTIEGFVSMTAWPLFIFLIFGSYTKLGLVVSISLLVSIIIMYVVGKKSDKNIHNKMKYLRFGGLGKGIVDLSKVIVSTVFGVYFVSIAKSIVGSFFLTPWFSEYYMHADEQPRSEYIMVMEMAVDLIRSAFSVFLIILSFFVALETLLIIALIFGGVGTIIGSTMPAAKSEAKLSKDDFKLMPRPQKKGTNA